MSTQYSSRCFSIPVTATAPQIQVFTSNEALIEDYLSWKRSYTSRAYFAYRIWITRFQLFVNKPPEGITHTDYVRFCRSLEGKYAPRCIEFALNVVHNYLRYFAEQGRLRFPMFLVRVPRATSRSHPAISEEEYQALVSTMRDVRPLPLRDLVILMLLHDTGLRIGELIGLQTEDIGDDSSAVVKTEKSYRFRRVFWNASTDTLLHDYLVERINNGPQDSDYLFTSDRRNASGAIAHRSVQRMLKRYLKRANISRDLCLHSFRHSFIHRLAKLGVPDAIIAQLVGHSTPYTISHYTTLSRPEFREYAERQLQFADKASLKIAA